jgi:hypothetical protein
MADSPDTTNPSPPLSPDGLSALARRLRAYAGTIRNHAAKVGMGYDMEAAADVLEGLVIDTTRADAVLQAVRDLVGGR